MLISLARLLPALVLLFLTAAGIVFAVTSSTILRTVESTNFFVDWSNSSSNLGDPEEINVLKWSPTGNPTAAENLTNTFAVGVCTDGDVEYFGNSWTLPAPQLGGKVLVGAGQTAGPWTPTGGPNAPSVSIDIGPTSSTNCPPSSAGVSVDTHYRFWDNGPLKNRIRVERIFSFTSAFSNDFRPYIPRLFPHDAVVGFSDFFPQVLYPTTSGTLASIGSGSCETGCTGPVVPSGSGASLLSPTWDSNAGWFAINSPNSGRGVIVRRITIGGTPQLWVDQDQGSFTNASSILLLQPTGGFTGTLIEEEHLCFYDSSIWTSTMQNNLKLPPRC